MDPHKSDHTLDLQITKKFRFGKHNAACLVYKFINFKDNAINVIDLPVIV